MTPSNGANSTATIQLTSKETAITTNNENVYSPADEVFNPMGINPATVTNLEIWFEKLPGFGVDVTAVDGSGGILGPVTVTARQLVDISAIFGEAPLHQVTAAPDVGVAQTVTSILRMRYDHDCL